MFVCGYQNSGIPTTHLINITVDVGIWFTTVISQVFYLKLYLANLINDYPIKIIKIFSKYFELFPVCAFLNTFNICSSKCVHILKIVVK